MREVVAPWKRGWDKARSPQHRTGVPPARHSHHRLVFRSGDLAIFGPAEKLSATSLMPCQEEGLVGSCHPCSSRLPQQGKPGPVQGSPALGGLGGALRGCVAKLTWPRSPCSPCLSPSGRQACPQPAACSPSEERCPCSKIQGRKQASP